jgi:hypothetical protein
MRSSLPPDSREQISLSHGEPLGCRAGNGSRRQRQPPGDAQPPGTRARRVAGARLAGCARDRRRDAVGAGWEIEAGLVYDEFAWFLYEELWDISLSVRTELTPVERRERIDQVLDPLLDSDLPDKDRATLVVDVFRSVLAARVLPLLGR